MKYDDHVGGNRRVVPPVQTALRSGVSCRLCPPSHSSLAVQGHSHTLEGGIGRDGGSAPAPLLAPVPGGVCHL